MRIKPARSIRGTIRLPGDKSISHRAALIASIAQGESRIQNFSDSEDCAATLSCLERLGVRIKREGDSVVLDGLGLAGMRQPSAPLHCGNSGSTMRMLAGILAGQSFTTTLTGDDSLNSRPMDRIVNPLERMGASVSSTEGRPPLVITGTNNLKPIRCEVPVPSAQVKTAVLLAGLLAEGHTEVIETGTTRDHTERLLNWFGVELEASEKKGTRQVGLAGPAHISGRDVSVPGDFSAAAFFIVTAAMLRDSDLQIIGVGVNPTRTKLIDVLQKLGGKLEIEDVVEESNEPVGKIRAIGSSLRRSPEWSGVISGELTAALIDELPLLAVLGSQIERGLEIRDAGELRLKESDRITATVENLRAMGATVREFDDGLKVDGPAKLKGALVNSFGDHRIAMAFAVAGLVARDETEISNSDCVAVSFPGFFEMLDSVVER